MRQRTYKMPPHSLEHSLRIPDSNVTLHFCAATPADPEAVTFEIPILEADTGLYPETGTYARFSLA
jgi:hypothetical protein